MKKRITNQKIQKKSRVHYQTLIYKMILIENHLRATIKQNWEEKYIKKVKELLDEE